MKLFFVRYTCGYGCEKSYLTVGETLDEVYKREKEKMENKSLWIVHFSVKEIDEVDGYKINVIR